MDLAISTTDAGVIAQLAATLFIATAVALSEIARKQLPGTVALATAGIFAGLFAVALPVMIMLVGGVSGFTAVLAYAFFGLFLLSTALTLWAAAYAHLHRSDAD